MGQTNYKHYAVFPEALIERPVANEPCPMRVSSDGMTLVERLVKMVEYDEGVVASASLAKYTSLQEITRGIPALKGHRTVDTGRSFCCPQSLRQWHG